MLTSRHIMETVMATCCLLRVVYVKTTLRRRGGGRGQRWIKKRGRGALICAARTCRGGETIRFVMRGRSVTKRAWVVSGWARMREMRKREALSPCAFRHTHIHTHTHILPRSSVNAVGTRYPILHTFITHSWAWQKPLPHRPWAQTHTHANTHTSTHTYSTWTHTRTHTHIYCMCAHPHTQPRDSVLPNTHHWVYTHSFIFSATLTVNICKWQQHTVNE